MFELEESEYGAGVMIEPILLLKGTEIQPVPNPCEDGASLTQFNNEYLKPGAGYAVVFGGAELGAVTVKTPTPNSADTMVEFDSTVPIHGMTMALARSRLQEFARKKAHVVTLLLTSATMRKNWQKSF